MADTNQLCVASTDASNAFVYAVPHQAGVVWVHKHQLNFASALVDTSALSTLPFLALSLSLPLHLSLSLSSALAAISFVHLIYFNDTQKYQVLLG